MAVVAFDHPRVGMAKLAHDHRGACITSVAHFRNTWNDTAG